MGWSERPRFRPGSVIMSLSALQTVLMHHMAHFRNVCAAVHFDARARSPIAFIFPLELTLISTLMASAREGLLRWIARVSQLLAEWFLSNAFCCLPPDHKSIITASQS